MRTSGKISLDNLFPFDPMRPSNCSYVVIGYDKTTLGIETKARTEISFHAERRAELTSDTNPYRWDKHLD